MIKRTLIAIAVIAIAASVSYGSNIQGYFPSNDDKQLSIYNWVDPNDQSDKDEALKVDGKMEVRWPFDYKYLTICKIPVKMKIGMYIRVDECDDKKVVLVQKDCEDAETVGKGPKDWPCYYGCVTVNILANFNAQIRGDLQDRSSVINGDKWSVSASPNTIAGDGNYHPVDLCIKTWQAKIEKAAAGDEVNVANLAVQARPAV